jgi:hypothetical protein
MKNPCSYRCEALHGSFRGYPCQINQSKTGNFYGYAKMHQLILRFKKKKKEKSGTIPIILKKDFQIFKFAILFSIFHIFILKKIWNISNKIQKFLVFSSKILQIDR